MRRMSVWAMDHHRTRWLVLSLVMRKRSSRYWKRQHRMKSLKLYTHFLNLMVKLSSQHDLAQHAFLWTDPLVVLLLLDLFDLVQELSDSQLQLGEFVLSCDFRVVVGMFSDLNIQMHSLQHMIKQTVEIYTPVNVLSWGEDISPGTNKTWKGRSIGAGSVC